ncbi:hypothetical protein SAMD00079811_59930 [Scytonema sp. HK-05]|nr:hypothetical protein SAMD00079811_59930 [Scytonema sp. HK-05]
MLNTTVNTTIVKNGQNSPQASLLAVSGSALKYHAMQESRTVPGMSTGLFNTVFQSDLPRL